MTISHQNEIYDLRKSPNKHICNRQVDHQVHAALAKTSVLHKNDNCNDIKYYYNKSLGHDTASQAMHLVDESQYHSVPFCSILFR